MGLLRFKKTIIAFSVIAGIALFGVIAIQFIRARSCSCENACVNNLRNIEGAKEEWALEHKQTRNDVVTWQDVQPYMGRGPGGSLPVCPQGGRYILGRVGEAPKCSIGGDHSLE